MSDIDLLVCLQITVATEVCFEIYLLFNRLIVTKKFNTTVSLV